MKIFKIIFGFLCLFITQSCSVGTTTNPDEEEPIPTVLTDEIEVYEVDLLHNNLVLAIENGGNTAYLVDKKGNKHFTWDFNSNLGNDLELLPDGRVLGIFKVENPDITFGGYGGIIKIINPDGSIDWEFIYSSNNFIAHHDVEMLPNGNILFLASERIEMATAVQFGALANEDIFIEKLVEVNTESNNIVWEWSSWNHIVQDINNSLDNFGNIAEFPELININYNLPTKPFVMHANGIDYDIEKDIIYMSVNAYSEIWVIDHSTTSAEAATSNGGNYNKGGNLLYRFGNPTTYNNSMGNRLFHSVHFPNLLENETSSDGNLLVYSNGTDIQQSAVFEIELPETLDLIANTDNEPIIVWDFTSPDMFSAIISGAIRLSNGNTLICEGDYGYWEITPNGEIAWKYNGIGSQKFWRGYAYDLDDESLLNLGLIF